MNVLETLSSRRGTEVWNNLYAGLLSMSGHCRVNIRCRKFREVFRGRTEITGESIESCGLLLSTLEFYRSRQMFLCKEITKINLIIQGVLVARILC